MENKTTTELLDLLTKLTDGEGNLKEGWEECWEELKNREPFYTLLNEEHEESVSSLLEMIKDLEAELKAEIKRLKRHKHDDKSGDVLIRI